MAIKLKNKISRVIFKCIFIVLILFSSAVCLILGYVHLTCQDSQSYFETRFFMTKYMDVSEDVLRDFLEDFSEGRDTEKEINKDDFIYIARNKVTGNEFSNMKSGTPVVDLLKNPTSLVWDSRGVSYLGESRMESYGFKKFIGSGTIEELKGTDWQYFTAFPSRADGSDIFAMEQTIYDQFKLLLRYEMIIIAIATGLYIFSLLMLSLLTATEKRNWFDRVPLEFQIMMILISLIPYISVMRDMEKGTEIKEYLLQFIGYGLLFIVAFLIVYLSLSRRVKNKNFANGILLLRLLEEMRILLGYKAWCYLMMGITIINNGFLFYGIGQRSVILIGVTTSLNLMTLYWLILHIHDFSHLMRAIQISSKGDIEEQAPLTPKTKIFQELDTDFSTIQESLNEAIKEAVKGEKMKTELITNITHDLKNPLTSIVNYIDLLKKEKGFNENTISYMDILEDKSRHLKLLIDHLVEAAKVSSGSLPVQIERLELQELMIQLKGEFEESLSNSGLQLMMNDINEPIWIYADSKHLWRILDNLMSNVIKYAMHGTRVYITIQELDHVVVMNIKNISSSVLSVPMDELTERFVRGDSSRATEGSGLGLSIAVNLAKLIHAELEFSIDGDLFKATLKLPKEEMIEGSGE